ncbi:hypothetical protein L873DRAFT_1931647 [Choiromyces venosus 120613-1]|uniref:Uncharacterized protein n=1 Tax=Choiromyces venosus 120613-1 TaxID=1336337 RepID=A0A3N4JAW3_9PEZI|nr:hypothetical protein L873DRAFT_1931647 [Choiromyces venosus 120613-1]
MSPAYTSMGTVLKMRELSGIGSVRKYGPSSLIRTGHGATSSCISLLEGSCSSSHAGSVTVYSRRTAPVVSSPMVFAHQDCHSLSRMQCLKQGIEIPSSYNDLTESHRGILSDSSNNDSVEARWGSSPAAVSLDLLGNHESQVRTCRDSDLDYDAREEEEQEQEEQEGEENEEDEELEGQEGEREAPVKQGKENEDEDDDEDIPHLMKWARLSQQVPDCGILAFHRQRHGSISRSTIAMEVKSHSNTDIATTAQQSYLVGAVTESLELTVWGANLYMDMEDGMHSNQGLSAEDRICLVQEQAAVAHWNEMEWCDIICPVIRHDPNLTTPTKLGKVAGIKLPLFVHQVSCVWWYLKQQQKACRAGMIGDEMGFRKFS